MLAFHEAVVRDPTQCDFRHGQVMGSSDSLDGSKRFEVGFVPVPSVLVSKISLNLKGQCTALDNSVTEMDTMVSST